MEEKINIVTKGEKTMVYTGQAPKILDPLPPVKTDIEGTIGTVAEYLKKRVRTGQFAQEDCHILVNRDAVKIDLILNESDAYKRGEVSGKMQFNPKFVEFGINTGKVWTPAELGMFVKMNRAFFVDRKENMELVTKLMNFQATVQNNIERNVSENGNRVDNFAQVVNSNLPGSFKIQIPIFKGGDNIIITVETFAQISGRDVAFVLLSPDAQDVLEDIRNVVIENELVKIREIAPEIAIIEQ